ncbi:MAG TPA: right-handed parallel beta-helix repeat-containing protein, partial [Anaerolineales bacterium]|nr:right-handed parallel beta-helix repeat-containing protein [Anaerolineales bacterium]
MRNVIRPLVLFALLCALVPSLSFASPNTIWIITNPDNSGSGTLREALENVSDGDTITFDPGVFPPSSPVTIILTSELPSLTHNNVTLTAEDAGVILEGGATSGGANGIIVTGSGNIVRGLRIQNFPAHGIYLAPGATGNTIGGDRTVGSGPYGQGNLLGFNGGNGIEIKGPGSSGNFIQGNFIGVDPLGMYAWPNGLNGVALWSGTSNNTVGGTSAGVRNVISGNTQNGVWIQGSGSTGNVVAGNFIGVRADGMEWLGNGFAGVSLQGGAADNLIGGTTAGARNIISGNQSNGIYLSDSGTTGNQILGNYVGTNVGGTAAIWQRFHGISITQGASGNFIGNGTEAGRNVLSGNEMAGVSIEGSTTTDNTVQGNYLGTNPTGTASVGNGLDGLLLQGETNGNLIGGNRLAGEGNLLSGNLNHGLVITTGAHDNTIQGNLIGPDASGTFSLGHQPWG